MDIEVNSVTSLDDMKNAINSQMAEGIEVMGINVLEDEAKNSMSVFAAADYDVAFRHEPRFEETTGRIDERMIESFLAREQVMVMKKTKKSEKEIDIRPLVYEMTFRPDGSIFMRLSAGSAANLKPELVMSTMLGMNGMEYDPYLLLITRLEMYARDRSGNLIPLESFQTVRAE